MACLIYEKNAISLSQSHCMKIKFLKPNLAFTRQPIHISEDDAAR